MQDPRNKIVEQIVSFLEEKGIDPLHAFTLIAVAIALSYYKDLKKWKIFRIGVRG